MKGMKGAKPFIPRHIHLPIIAIKKTVVKLKIALGISAYDCG